MTTLALVNACDLVAEELRQSLEQRHDLWHDMRLLVTSEDELGTLAEVRGSAAVMTAAAEQDFSAIDVVFLFGCPESYRPLLAAMPAAVTSIVSTGLETPPPGQPLIAGINLDALDRHQTLISPHPAAIGLSHLLRPLLPLSPAWISGTATLPVSMFGKQALDGLFDQARMLLTFTTNPEPDKLPSPLAFNLLDSEVATGLGDQVRAAIGTGGPQISLQAIHAGVFHGMGLTVHLGFDDPGVSLGQLVEALESEPQIDFAADPQLLGPKDVVGREEILISEVRATGDGTFALWAALDQLTVGGARNLVAILEALTMPVCQ